jgi:hypothetical protein
VTLPDGRTIVGGPLITPQPVPDIDGTISHFEVYI